MGRDTSIRFYTTDENKEWLTEQAEATDQSLSEYCDQLITEHVTTEQDRQQYDRYAVDQQIELVLNEISDEATAILSNFQSETAPALDRIQRIRTVYVIALWHLFKSDYSPSQRNAALEHAGEYVGRAPSNNPELQAALSTSSLQSSDAPIESDSSTQLTGGDSK